MSTARVRATSNGVYFERLRIRLYAYARLRVQK